MQTTANHPIQTDVDHSADPAPEKQRARVTKQIQKRSFATLATVSPAGRPHVAGVVYDTVDSALWLHTMRSSRKARNIDASGHVAVCIPFRPLPMGPPYTIQFQTTARIVAMDDPEVRRLLAAGELGRVSGHGALEMADGCFVRIDPPTVVHSYGLGAKVIDLIRDPLNSGARTVRFDR